MPRQSLPCAEKNCKGKMILIENKKIGLGYSCLESDDHNFRYNIKRKRWDKIIITSKPILYYKENPFKKIIT